MPPTAARISGAQHAAHAIAATTPPAPSCAASQRDLLEHGVDEVLGAQRRPRVKHDVLRRQRQSELEEAAALLLPRGQLRDLPDQRRLGGKHQPHTVTGVDPRGGSGE